MLGVWAGVDRKHVARVFEMMFLQRHSQNFFDTHLGRCVEVFRISAVLADWGDSAQPRLSVFDQTFARVCERMFLQRLGRCVEIEKASAQPSPEHLRFDTHSPASNE